MSKINQKLSELCRVAKGRSSSEAFTKEPDMLSSKIFSVVFIDLSGLADDCGMVNYFDNFKIPFKREYAGFKISPSCFVSPILSYNLFQFIFLSFIRAKLFNTDQH